ncbi:hypothetical protein [Planctomonas deserti]|uniref:hypothetical protein n=1 Tax=Planctomonas deserti TaxID=2144185 RepID=UPI000D3B7BE9|nr:hypothetical protein [Planctomonas deserti]
MKLNTPFGRVMYALSLVMTVVIIAVLWIVIKPDTTFGLLFTAFAVGIAVWNGRLAFRRG